MGYGAGLGFGAAVPPPRLYSLSSFCLPEGNPPSKKHGNGRAGRMGRGQGAGQGRMWVDMAGQKRGRRASAWGPSPEG